MANHKPSLFGVMRTEEDLVIFKLKVLFYFMMSHSSYIKIFPRELYSVSQSFIFV